MLILLIFFLFLFSGNNLLAAPNLSNALTNAQTAGTQAGYLEKDFFDVFIAIINTVVGLLGIVFIALMIYGGYLWMIARGNEETVEKSKKLITAAVIGLIIVVSAYAISYFVVDNIGDATLRNSSAPTGSGSGYEAGNSQNT